MRIKPDLAREVRTRVAAFAAQHCLRHGDRPLRIGFSGGADSTALLLLVREWTPDVVAVHFHHGIRGRAADRDAAWCARFCAERGIPFALERLAVPDRRQRGEGLEEAARRCRLEFWATHVAGPASVALGHHADDQLEELLLRLIRGANCSGLASLRPVRTLHGVRFIRPLLCLRRAEIEAFLLAEGISTWRSDRTNADCRLRRNAIRHELLPLIRRLAGHDRGLLASLTGIQADADFLEQETERHRLIAATVDELRSLHPALRPRALRLWLQTELGRDVIPNQNAIARIGQRLAQAEGSGTWQVPLGQGLRLACARGRLELVRAELPVSLLLTRTWNWQRQPRLDLPEAGLVLLAEVMPRAAIPTFAGAGAAEYFAAGELPPRLTVRAWRPGDRLLPFGSPHEQKLQDLFTNARIPRGRRSLVPLLLAGDRIVWAAGVRRAEFGRVDATSGPARQVVRLSVNPSPKEGR
jgi:tRNA(Ile)-lysidine synthase